jgi:DNA modification methylase
MKGGSYENVEFGEWDSEEAAAQFKLMKGLVKQSFRLLVPGGSFYCFCDRLFIGELWELAKCVGFSPKTVMTWVKANPTPQGRNNFSSATEFFLFAVKPGARYVWNELDAAEMTNAPEFAKSTGRDREMFPHPTQKPRSLIERYIKISSNPGDVVCDPMAGSGTTGHAAWRLNRRSILIEKDEGYAKTIRERITLLECPPSEN